MAAVPERTQPTVRALTSDEWQALRSIRLKALKSDPLAFMSTYEHELEFDEQRWRSAFDHGMWTVLSVRDEVIGMLGVTWPGTTTPHDTCYFEYLWINPAWRRGGRASDLITTVLRQLREDGFTTIRLWVLEGNDAAARLYSGLGFAFTGRSKPLRDNPARNENLMQLHPSGKPGSADPSMSRTRPWGLNPSAEVVASGADQAQVAERGSKHPDALGGGDQGPPLARGHRRGHLRHLRRRSLCWRSWQSWLGPAHAERSRRPGLSLKTLPA